jgi:hypothetical protein
VNNNYLLDSRQKSHLAHEKGGTANNNPTKKSRSNADLTNIRRK